MPADPTPRRAADTTGIGSPADAARATVGAAKSDDEQSRHSEDSCGSPDTGRESHDALMARLYREHNQSLIRFLMTRVASEQEAQDVAHEAYVRLLQLDSKGAVSYLSAYLFRTAANIAIDRIRRGHRGQRIYRSFLTVSDALLPPPEQALESEQQIELIARYVDELPPKCRQAFYLHRVEDMSLDDIAGKLGVTKRMVHHYILRAIVYCRSRMDGTIPAPPSRRSTQR